jgi:hypothetical protein
MCDYSLQHLASRSANVGDKLVSTNFIGTITRGFAEVGAPNVAVCLLPGTEIAFDREVAFYDLPGFPSVRTAQNVARFRQVEKDKPYVHHDALEFPDGQIVLLTALCEGQHATVLQLPVIKRPEGRAEASLPAEISAAPTI